MFEDVVAVLLSETYSFALAIEYVAGFALEGVIAVWAGFYFVFWHFFISFFCLKI